MSRVVRRTKRSKMMMLTPALAITSRKKKTVPKSRDKSKRHDMPHKGPRRQKRVKNLQEKFTEEASPLSPRRPTSRASSPVPIDSVHNSTYDVVAKQTGWEAEAATLTARTRTLQKNVALVSQQLVEERARATVRESWLFGAAVFMGVAAYTVRVSAHAHCSRRRRSRAAAAHPHTRGQPSRCPFLCPCLARSSSKAKWLRLA